MTIPSMAASGIPAAAVLIALTCSAMAATRPALHAQTPPPQIRVFLDCTECFSDFLRTEVTFVDYVRDRSEADVHILVTSTETGGGGREYTAAFIGAGSYQGIDHTLKAVTTPSDSEDVVRRQLATTVRIGLLNYVARSGVPQRLGVTVRLGSEDDRPAVTGDRWNNWVFSLQGSASFEGEESSRESQLGASVGADRITPDWKITLGAELDHETEEFDLDEDEPVKVKRQEREFSTLTVKSLGEHWSAGVSTDLESSTFNNIRFSAEAGPAIEFNVFPYSQYTRRQLRVLYLLGAEYVRYYEETLYGKLEETLPRHELDVTYEQRERWGSLQASLEGSQYLHDLSKSRLEADGQVSLRVVRGLSIAAQLTASRIRDQLSLPRRGATPEEIFLRLRELQSGYQYDFQFSLTYSFGSIFSSIVNPRFGS
jgi:hypothetical protein